jgi:predicted regulator of Ras-like GTPase activity (Roadblock/LC7/MglB family)
MNVDFAELDDRIAKCQKILDADPNSQIFAALAEAYRKKRMVDKALDVCRKGLELHPDYSSAYIVLSKIFMDQGNFKEADRQLSNAIRIGGRTRSSDILQSEILIKLGQREKARTILGKLQKSDPQNDTVRRLLVSIESDNKMAGMESVRMPEHPHPIEQPRSEEAPKRAYTLSNALSIIKVLPRVLGVVAVGTDGIVIEGHFDGMLSKDELGALASGAFGSIASGIGKVNLGKPLEVLIESEQSKLWMLSHERMLIIVSMRDDVNLGSMKLKVNEIFKNTLFT